MKPYSIVWHEVLDSTNNELKRRLFELDNLSVVAAKFQTAGRGQGTHSWNSAPGENLTFSILLKFGCDGIVPLKAAQAILITQISTLAVVELLENEGVEAKIKWPNDIWTGGKKICGMLIENTVQSGMIVDSIIGIGLNLNQKEFDPKLPNPVSLGLLTGKSYEVEASLEDFSKIFFRLLDEISSPDGREKIQRRFAEYVFVLDEERAASLKKAIEDYEASLRP